MSKRPEGAGDRDEPIIGKLDDELTRDSEPIRSVAGETVEGERDIPSVNRDRSLQSRVNNWMALGLMLLLGGGFLYFYFQSQFSKQQQAEDKVAQERATKSAGEMKLPPLGSVEGPRAASTDTTLPPDEGPTPIGDVLGPAPPLGAPGAVAGAPGVPPPPQGPPPKTPAELDLERKLLASVLTRGGFQGVGGGAGAGGAGSIPVGFLGGPRSDLLGSASPIGNAPNSTGSLGANLMPTATPSTSAQLMATRRFAIPKGSFVDCTLETALDSQLPGMVTCITALDIMGADGTTVLIERGSKLVGETRGESRQGMSRIFVLWNEVRTPTGVVAQLASPSSDSLGRSGIKGEVDTHFWQRFGSAIMISIIDGTIQALVASQRSGANGPSVVYSPQGSREVMTEVLRNTITIPPTITVNQGARVQVIVARDVDFRSVYELRMAASAN